MNENFNPHENYPDSQEKIDVPTMKVIPLKKICMTIGQLPTAYLETMSYYEMLIWFIEYLKNNIIPTINNNAQAVQEVQNVVMNLQTYINNFKDSIDEDVEGLEEYMNNYFDNLDVQEEINNKLDEMLEDGVLEQIIEQFIQSTAIWCFDTVADMKQATNLINGSFARTLGYYSANDDGGATYKITNTESETEYQEILNSGLYATLIVEKYLDVKQIGAKGDGLFDNTNIFKKAISLLDTYSLFFSKGLYITQHLTNLSPITKDIYITGDNATIKMKDNSVLGDYYALFWFEVQNGSNCNINIENLTIDMNYTHNNSVVIESGNNFALQHCCALGISSDQNGTAVVNVNIRNMIFKDLIADGIYLSTESQGIFNSIIIDNILSYDRTATRSDICYVCDFKDSSITNCNIDKIEAEINHLSQQITTRNYVLSNCNIKQACDLDTKSVTSISNFIISNCSIYNYLFGQCQNMLFDNCYIKVNDYIRFLINGELIFSNCIFEQSSINYDTYFRLEGEQVKKATLNNCTLNLTDFDGTYIFKYEKCDLSLNNCSINIKKKLVFCRNGYLVLNNNKIYSNDNTYLIVNGLVSDSFNYIAKNNISLSDSYLLQLPIDASSSSKRAIIYDNNPEWQFGKSIYSSRMDKINSFNGGSGNLNIIKEMTSYLSESEPNVGFWIKGQIIRKSNDVSTNVGWICTKSGTFITGSVGDQPTFRAI